VATVHLSLSTAPPIHEALVIGRKGHFRLVERPAGPPFENLYRLEKNGDVLLDGLQAPSLYAHQLREFAEAVRQRRTPLASGREILSAMRMLDAARLRCRAANQRRHRASYPQIPSAALAVGSTTTDCLDPQITVL